VYNSSCNNTVNKTILETKLQFYILLMCVRDSGRTLNVDENRSIGASSPAAAVSSSAAAVSCSLSRWHKWAWSLLYDRRSL